MTPITKRIFLSLCTLTVFSFFAVGVMFYDSAVAIATSVDRNKTIYELESQLGTMKTERSNIQSQINSDKKEVASLESEIKLIDDEISILTAQSFIISQLYNEWLAISQESEAQIEQLEIQKEAELDAFDSMLRMSYMHGDDTYFELIFGSENIVDFLSRTDMLAYHFQANDNVLTNLTTTITGLELAVAQYDESLVQLGVFEEEQNNILAALEERSAYATQRKAELQSNIETNEAQLSAKDSEMAQIEADLKELYRQQQPTEYAGSGTFYTPTKNYRISSGFTNRISPITGRPEKHNGLDFAAPGGTPIFAAESGTVIDSRYSSSWGNVVQIDHGGGIVTLYAHCSARLVSKGQTVKRGDTIALVGSTGWSTGNHLHFTVYKNGVAVDPRGYLAI